MTIEEPLPYLLELNPETIRVLYWVCRGRTNEWIAKFGTGTTLQNVQYHLTKTYKGLGFPEKMDNQRKRNLLKKEICKYINFFISEPNEIENWPPDIFKEEEPELEPFLEPYFESPPNLKEEPVEGVPNDEG